MNQQKTRSKLRELCQIRYHLADLVLVKAFFRVLLRKIYTDGFVNVNTAQGLKELNSFLIYKSYISDYRLSKANISAFDTLVNGPAGDYPHGIVTSHIFVPAKSLYALDHQMIWIILALIQTRKPKVQTSGEHLAVYSAKKSKKLAFIDGSTVWFDVKPWDDGSNMVLAIFRCLVPLSDKASIDLLTGTNENFEDFVQSVDIAAFSKF
uniref:Uncharacterized protein n=1 Tax=Glossina pallidipes TaxID=7398 RepID=A0A1A9ZBW7_GLOPL